MIKDNNTSSFLPFDEDIDDKCGNNWIVIGNPEIKDVSDIGEGVFDTALYLDDSSYLNLNNNLPITDFSIPEWTIDFWYFIPTGENKRWRCMVCINEKDVDFNGITIWEESSGSDYPGMAYFIGANSVDTSIDDSINTGTGDNNWNITHAQLPYLINSWVHTVIVKKNYTYKCFINGKLEYESTTNKIFIGAKNYYIGYWSAYGNETRFVGYIKNFRISNIARWENNYDVEEVKSNIINLQNDTCKNILNSNAYSLPYKAFKFK